MEMNSGPGGYVVLVPLVAMETQEWNVVEQWEKNGDELRCSRRVCSSCSTSGNGDSRLIRTYRMLLYLAIINILRTYRMLLYLRTLKGDNRTHYETI
jgi:hypothetical protein